MSDIATKIRHVEALLRKTVAAGAFPAEAETAQRMARELIKRHGLEAHFNGKIDDREWLRRVDDVIREAWNFDPVKAAADRFWAAMRASGASEEAVRREQPKWEREHPPRNRGASEEAFERAREEWERARADFTREAEREREAAEDEERARQRRWDEMTARWAREEHEHRKDGAKRGWEKRRQKQREARNREYKGVLGTVRAVREIGGVVNKRFLAEWFGITEGAAGVRLWRATLAGLLKKVPGGYVCELT